MKFDLYDVRVNKYKYTIEKFAKFAGIGKAYYAKYEKEGEIPSKYIFNLWTRLPDFPIPNDFFYYTSVTLLVNMKYHRLSQKEIAELFGLETQASVSKYTNGQYPMYEKKECFKNVFDPLIIPFILNEDEEMDKFYPITDLSPRGMLGDDYLKMAKSRVKVKKE